MKKVAIDEVEIETNPMEVHSVRKPVSRALGTEHFAMNYFELEPRESFSGGMHTHHDQEEVFYVQEGTATFETPDDEIAVAEGELIRFAPGDYQKGYNDPGGGRRKRRRVRARRTRCVPRLGRTRIYGACPDCGDEKPHGVDLVAGGFRLTCTDCGNSFEIGG